MVFLTEIKIMIHHYSIEVIKWVGESSPEREQFARARLAYWEDCLSKASAISEPLPV